jgi:hypothetical protein
MSIFQLHWQWIENGKIVKTENKMQRNVVTHKGMEEFVRDAKEKFPLPEGAIWLFVTEKSQYFEKYKD